MTTPDAGWYPDPHGEADLLRWFDGTAWTEHTHAAEVAPVAAAEPAAAAGAEAPAPVTVLPASVPRRLRRRVVLSALTAVVVLGGAAGALAYTRLSGGGTQPEEVLPANAIGYLEVDLDPSAAQKLAAYEFARRFPEAKVKGEESLRDDLLEAVLDDQLPEGASYDADIKPWLGDRIGVVVLDTLDEDGEPVVLAALQAKDLAKARTSLTHLRDLGVKESGTQDASAFAVDERGYVVLGDTQAQVDAARRTAERAPLSGSSSYRAALDALGERPIVTAWADLGKVWDALPADAFEGNPLFDKEDRPRGAVVLGATVHADRADIVGKALGVTTGAPVGGLGSATGSALVGSLPQGALGAGSITGLGSALGELYTSLKASLDSDPALRGFFGGADAADLDSYLTDDLGLTLPADLVTVLGKETAFGVYPDDAFVVRARGGDPKGARATLRRLAAVTGAGADPDEQLAVVGKDLVVADSAKTLAKARARATLASDPAYREAVPDAARAAFVLYLDLAKIFSTYGDELFATRADRAKVQPLGSLGLTVTGGSSGGFHLRLSLR